jgi:hypothetical protein
VLQYEDKPCSAGTGCQGAATCDPVTGCSYKAGTCNFSGSCETGPGQCDAKTGACTVRSEQYSLPQLIMFNLCRYSNVALYP